MIKKANGFFKYPNSETAFELIKYKLSATGKPIVYYFKGGHWCTDCVFEDLINMSTGAQNYIGKQLTLF